MRIAIDARELCGHSTGVGRYLGEIVREWSRMPAALRHHFVFCSPEPLHVPAIERLPSTVRTEQGHGVWWEQRVLPRLVRESQADVLFAPGYSGPILSRTPLVVAIHDVSFAARPEWFRWREGLKRRWVTRLSAQRAARVLTISEFSRGEIHERLGVPLGRISVIVPGPGSYRGSEPAIARASRSNAPFGSDPRSGSSPGSDPILFVGSVFNRRHLPELMTGFARLAKRRSTARLTIVGENRTFPHIDLERLRSAASDRIDLRSYVADEELDALYKNARAFVFLSEYEGFGLTPVEALSRGIPIVVLDTPVAREVYGDAAIYVARPDPALIDAALDVALYDDAVRTRLLERAPLVLARYSWRECAEQVLTVLEQAGARPGD